MIDSLLIAMTLAALYALPAIIMIKHGAVAFFIAQLIVVFLGHDDQLYDILLKEPLIKS